ncbi:hypothetical protein ACFOKI_10395 [Sphingomonas qilianensis]|uniref:Uncharacterized protein n=1 Tax=Sphingomonas qilianensis TaxID=1736690 RepID=A0ABU9XPX4_9SPHN
MSEDDKAYHARRAATQRWLAERSSDPAAAAAHLALAALHDDRAAGGTTRPMLRMAVPR